MSGKDAALGQSFEQMDVDLKMTRQCNGSKVRYKYCGSKGG